MPCCAFAACVVAQILLCMRAIRRAIFGPGAGESTVRNVAVEWRLDSVAPPLDLASARRIPGRRALRGLALVAAVEVLLAVGVIYGIVEHLGHGAGHSGHAHRVVGAGLDRARGGDASAAGRSASIAPVTLTR